MSWKNSVFEKYAGSRFRAYSLSWQAKSQNNRRGAFGRYLSSAENGSFLPSAPFITWKPQQCPCFGHTNKKQEHDPYRLDFWKFLEHGTPSSNLSSQLAEYASPKIKNYQSVLIIQNDVQLLNITLDFVLWKIPYLSSMRCKIV